MRPSLAHRPRARPPKRLLPRAATPRRVPNSRRRRWRRRPCATHRAEVSPEPCARSRPKATAAVGAHWPWRTIQSDGMRHAAQEVLRPLLLRGTQKVARPALLDDLAAV